MQLDVKDLNFQLGFVKTLTPPHHEMDKLINVGVFVGGAFAGSFIATNAAILKDNLAMLFVPPGPDQSEEDQVGCGKLLGEDEEEED